MKFTYLKLVALVAIITLTSCNCSSKKEFKKPNGLITNKQADKLEEAYKANQHKAINNFLSQNGINVIDNREVWFSLEELENYIEYVKQESKKQNLEDLGIRVYFGAKMNEKKEMKSTIFFYPTHNSATRAAAENFNSYGIQGLNYGSSGDPVDEFRP
ncbi:hypothetical protein SAMN05444411_10726 [Lutibacter oricola]|uniref:Uncharacterized protein n=1 Tax=Lutibacter oricola TaxID=762486 RepID=A0A1H3D1V7_9FLAO|nr:hypothetical protein [Lutibacter oricola]SDX60250.1 hypothetical protein SAMN05444411_10726 [Lutibacter oricola]